MSECHYLIGADDVKTAGYQMSSAAQDMLRAAAQIDESLMRQREFFQDWLVQLEHILDKTKENPSE